MAEPAAAERFVCIHGHFYQPPRDNPWLDAIEAQESAAPFNDWNERVTAECYAPNALARLLNDRGQIVGLRNNYEHISFNFGPTLLSWMEKHRPDTYAAIQAADRAGFRHYGRGNALAQVYGHCIMPLATPRDSSTQVRWGVADFVYRFGRRPDGMWLPETAVDLASLRALAEQGIRFSILAAGQASRVRLAGGAWQPAGDHLDTTRPYRCDLGNGRSIILFFYNGGLAHGVAFGGLLTDGHDLARRLVAGALAHPEPALLHIATDGESYGHHHRFGDMALAAAIEAIRREHSVRLTNYAAYLDRYPVRDEVEIRNGSSWSCVHGIERWRANCGCRLSNDDWQQTWRGPLRESLDWLKHQIDESFERLGAGLLSDVWAARDAYVDVVLKPHPQHRDAFIEQQCRRGLNPQERSRVWQLLEMQRFCLLSFTSCGWFFDEPSGLETTQVLTYAARAVQLAAALGSDLEAGFLRHLAPMRSNLPRYVDGAALYQALVQPAVSDVRRMVANYAINGLFEAPTAEQRVYGCRFTRLDHHMEKNDAATLIVGRTHVLAQMTEESHEFVHATLHLGGHEMQCAVFAGKDFVQTCDALVAAFLDGSADQLVHQMSSLCGGNLFTLRDVFAFERRRILKRVAAQALSECSADYERIVQRNRRLIDFLARSGAPLPDELRVAATFVLQRRFEQTIAALGDSPDLLARAQTIAEEAERWGIRLDTGVAARGLESALSACLKRTAVADTPGYVQHAHSLLDAAERLCLPIELSSIQNDYYALLGGDPNRARQCTGDLRRLGRRLQFELPEWSE
ncbi:MAG: DUF3536 domain-containing protein [Deltaproteobacteria bacterium]|nr:DUF3536 domain-containing protein [Deltaproteobacteria bacterium]